MESLLFFLLFGKVEQITVRLVALSTLNKIRGQHVHCKRPLRIQMKRFFDQILSFIKIHILKKHERHSQGPSELLQLNFLIHKLNFSANKFSYSVNVSTIFMILRLQEKFQHSQILIPIPFPVLNIHS